MVPVKKVDLLHRIPVDWVSAIVWIRQPARSSYVPRKKAAEFSQHSPGRTTEDHRFVPHRALCQAPDVARDDDGGAVFQGICHEIAKKNWDFGGIN